MFDLNLILDTDSYKFSHHRQNPEGTTVKNSYIEARGGAFGYTTFCGLQIALETLAAGVGTSDVDEAEEMVTAHMGPGIFDRAGWDCIATHGYLPLVIEALPEGTCAPHGTPLVQVRNTDDRFPWLPAFVETMLLRAVWYPSTVATLSREAKRIMAKYLDDTAEDAAAEAHLPFMLHDFGSRGVSSRESAGIGGFAHLVNFKGTDTVEALRVAKEFYSSPMAGFSVCAAEHSTATMDGPAGEANFVRRMLREFGGQGKIISVVGDSYDIYNFAGNIIGEQLKQDIIDSGARLVIRPDSGDPVEVVSEVMRITMAKHGAQLNAKGFYVLPPHVRVIQGDGVDLQSIESILSRLKDNRVSAENVVFGMGGALLQKVNRDTCKFAMKTSAAKVNGEWRDVRKQPITDKGKVSKAGVFKVFGDMSVDERDMECDLGGGILERTFVDGDVIRHQTLENIRARAAL